MKFMRVLFLFIFILPAAYAISAERDFKFSKIDFIIRTITSEDTTVVGLDRAKLRKLGRAQGWGMIEAYYESVPEWADDINVKYYVLIKQKNRKKYAMLAGAVTYIHVKKGKGHMSAVYIPPQAIDRYGEILKIRAELWYNGILQDAVVWSKKGSKVKGPWWIRIKPSYGSLFNRFYTPFEHEAQVREEVIKID